MTTPMPIIEGATDPKLELEQKAERQELLEQASQMDQVRVVPVDELRDYSDIKKPTSQENLLEQAAAINKRLITDKQRANLERARAAKAEKKRLLEATGSTLAKGTPAPDLLVNLSKRLDEIDARNGRIEQRLVDLIKIQPYEAPLQTQHIVPRSKPVPRVYEGINDDQTVRYMPRNDRSSLEDPAATFASRKRKSNSDYEKDLASYNKTYQETFDHFEYENEPMAKRVELDPGMGRRASTQALIREAQGW